MLSNFLSYLFLSVCGFYELGRGEGDAGARVLGGCRLFVIMFVWDALRG